MWGKYNLTKIFIDKILATSPGFAKRTDVKKPDESGFCQYLILWY